MFNKDIYIERRDALRSKVKHGIIILLGNSESSANYPANGYRFRQDSTFLYFFGLNTPGFVGVLDVEASTDCLYADDYTMDDIIWMGDQPTVRELGSSVGVNSTFGRNELMNTIYRAIKHGRKVHFLPPYREANLLLMKSLIGIKTDFIHNYVSVELIKAVVSLREIKDEDEIKEIEFACETGYLMHTTAMKLCRAGIFEREIAGAIEGIALSRGAGVSFQSIVSQNGETLHNHFHGNKLHSGKLMLVDAGAETDMNYCSDFTRTLPVSGKFTQKQRDIYNIVLSANNRVFGLIKSGITYQSVHIEAAKIISSGLKDLGLLKGEVSDIVENGAYAMFMPHGLGHQMGLDVHDMEGLGEKYVGYNELTERSSQFGLGSLRMGRKLLPGHVITVEPGIYFIPALIKKWRNEKINRDFINYDTVNDYLDFGGIRLEDDALVLANGCRMLGKQRVPITIADVEEYMRDGD